MNDQACCEAREVRYWYNNPRFSLVPRIRFKCSEKPKGNWDSGITSRFHFDWLFLHIWTLDIPGFEIGFVADTHWGIGIVGILPYLRWTICIPCPEKWTSWIYRNLQRKP